MKVISCAKYGLISDTIRQRTDQFAIGGANFVAILGPRVPVTLPTAVMLVTFAKISCSWAKFSRW